MAWNDDERRDEEEENEEDEVDETDYKAQKDAVLFAIHVSKSMMQKPPASDSKKADNDSALKAALKSAYQLMQQRIIAQPKDYMGVLLFGTSKSKFRDTTTGRTAYPHCYLLTDLDIPSAEDVKALKALAEDDDDDHQVLESSDEDVVMANVLFCANQIFTTNAPNFGSRRLFIVTDDDDPQQGNKQARSAAAVRAKDLADLGVGIELFPISREEHSFSLDKFYSDIIYRDPSAGVDDDDEIKTCKSGDGLTLLASLISHINSKQTPKRAYFSDMALEIAPGLTISVNGYNPLHRQAATRSCYIHVDSEIAQIATGETTRTDDSIKTVDKAQIRKAYKFGGEYVHFTAEELKKIREFDGKGIRIIGFKPRAMLPSWASVKNPIFIFPTEKGYVGSTRVFSALWQKLLKSDKIAIAWYIARSNAVPLVVAIVPSSGENSPAGLWLVPLPFVDDMRDTDSLKPQHVHRASDELTNQMRTVVQNLQLPKATYAPSKYPNPALQWHYKILQILALDEEVPDGPPEDATVPRFKIMDKRVGGYQAEWRVTLENEARLARDRLAIKREADAIDADDQPPSKKARSTAPSASSAKPALAMRPGQLQSAAKAGTLQKLTVAQLRAALAEHNLDQTGLKSALVDRLEHFLEKR